MFAEVCSSPPSPSVSSSSSSFGAPVSSFGHQSAFLFVCIGFDAPVFLLLTIIAQSTDAIRMRSAVRLLHPPPPSPHPPPHPPQPHFIPHHPTSQALQLLQNPPHHLQLQQHLQGTSNAIYLAKGMRGRIDCPLRADPPHTVIVWIKDNRPLGEVEMGGGRVKVNQLGSLLIRSAAESDEGDYACVAYSPLERKQNSPLVHVLVKDLPYFTATPKPVYQRQPMQLVHMPCIAHGDPFPSITWQKVDGRFPSTTRTLQDGGNLTIARLTRDDQGLYECIAVNLVASIVTTSLLLIEVTTPHGPTNVTVRTTDQSATISWYPAFDGGRPISHTIWHRAYTEEMSVSDNLLRNGLDDDTRPHPPPPPPPPPSLASDDWETFQVIPNDTMTITIHNLVDNTAYQFFVLSNLLWSGKMIQSSIVMARTTKKLSEVSDWPAPTLTTTTSLSNRTDVDGHTLFPPNQPSFGHNIPSYPINVRVKQLSNGLLLSWSPPKSSPIPVAYYSIEYRTVGQWVPLSSDEPIVNLTYLWPTASRGVTYHFRVTSHARESQRSRPSEIVTFNTGSEIGDNATVYNASAIVATVSVVAIVLLVGVAVYVALRTIARLRAARTHRQPTTMTTLRYENVKYCGPNHHQSSPKTMVAKGLLDTRNSLVASVLTDDAVNNALNDHSNDCLHLHHTGLSCCDRDHATLTNDSSNNHREMIQVEATV